jgi:uncharacterized protein YecE (DUF72 family)
MIDPAELAQLSELYWRHDGNDSGRNGKLDGSGVHRGLVSGLRLHGRNAEGYINGKTVAERFDYLYSDDELEAIAQRAVTLAAKAAEIHVVYNNNASDYPLRNAATFQQLLARNYPEAMAGDRHSQSTPFPRPAGQTLEFDFTAAQEPNRNAAARPGTGKSR